MMPMLRVRTTVCLSILALVLVVLASPGSSAERRAASLSVSPGVYVGGQKLTFEGNLGVAGRKRIRLQVHMNRPGDAWSTVDGFRARTARDGSFRFTYPAPAMFGIRMRVVSGRLATPSKTFDARSQDLVLRTVTDRRGVADGQVVKGVPFAILVDTTPDLHRRPDLPAPAFPGRTLTLQQRVDGNHWQRLRRTTTNGKGNGRFKLTRADQAASIALASTGLARGELPRALVYRVRQENWTANGNAIGWFPSFPTSVKLLDAPRRRLPAAPQATRAPAPKPKTSTAGSLARSGGSSAGQAHGWSPALWDFTWEYGESLTSKPGRGTDRRGRWLDTSNGSGRASKHNGGLMLDSQREFDGRGDFGTTSVTMAGNPMKYGRWEAKMRLKLNERNARNYRAVIELVPARRAAYHCGAQNITVADVRLNGSTVTVGAKALRGDRRWTRSTRLSAPQSSANSFAVEVAKGHISWFMGGKVIATLKSKAAVSDVPMTLRMSLVGDGRSEMNKTQFISDWQRGYSIDRGRQVLGGPGLKRGTHNGGC